MVMAEGLDLEELVMDYVGYGKERKG
jgi:hypothetical protein